MNSLQSMLELEGYNLTKNRKFYDNYQKNNLGLTIGREKQCFDIRYHSDKHVLEEHI